MKILLIIACVLAIIGSTTGLFLWVTAVDDIPVHYITTTERPISVPVYGTSTPLAEPSTLQSLPGRPMTVVIKHLGPAHATEGQTSCWWSVVKTDSGPRHLRIDFANQVATRVVVLSDQAVEESIFTK